MKELFNKSIHKRRPILNDETNSGRLFDGSGDGLSDYYLDQYGEHLLLSTKSGMIEERVLKTLDSMGQSVYWKKLDQHEKESPTLLCGLPVDDPFTIRENGLQYKASFNAGYSQGIFLDQRLNRARVKSVCSTGDRVLNTYAYTGAFSVCAARSGATTTTLDLSQTYLSWAKDNMTLNNISIEDHYFCKGDTFHWLERFAKSGKTFHGIILDPPTFSRDAKGKVFRVEKDYHTLARLASPLLEPGGWILACTNCRKLSHWEFEAQLENGLGSDFQLSTQEMPPEYSEEPYLKSVWCTKQ